MKMDDLKQLEAEQVRDVYANSVFASFVSFILVSALSVCMWSHISHQGVLFWSSVNILFIALHYILLYRFRKASQADIDYSRWKRIVHITFTLRGVAFGSAGILLFSHSQNPQSILIFVLVGMVGGSVGSYHMMKRIAIMFTVAYLAPLSYSLLSFGGIHHAILAALSLLYMSAMILMSGKLNKTYIENVTLRIEKESLANHLALNISIFDNLAEGIYLIGAEDMKIKWANPVLEKMLGYGKGELMGKPVNKVSVSTEMLPQKTDGANATGLEETGEWHGEVQNIRKDGTYFWCHANMSVFEHSKYGRVIVSVQADITDIKKAEQRLQSIVQEKSGLIDRLDMLYRAIEATQVGLTICDDERTIIYVNAADARMHGYSAGELVGQKTSTYTGKAVANQKKLSELSLKDGWVRESVNIRKDGREFPVLLSSVYIKDEQGKPNAMVTSCEDITELKENEARLEKSLEDRDMLIKEVHHRVKNNLAVIQSLLRLQSSHSSDRATVGALDESASRVRAMSLVHERLYTSSDLSALEFSSYMQSLVRQIYENYSTDNKAIAIKVDIPETSIDVDTIIPCGLIVNELLTNIFKYAFPDGRAGEIYIAIQYDEIGSPFLVVRDNGVGLPEGFDINSGGSLGMRIVTSLSAQVGAGVTYRSEGGGTEFRVLLKKHLLEPIVWIDSEYLTGHVRIDEQHRGLFKEIKNLQAAIESGLHQKGVDEVIPKLISYAEEHFELEEQLMKQYGYTDIEKHMKAHRDFSDEVTSLVEKIRSGEKGLSLQVYEFLHAWLENHIGGHDKDMGEFLRDKGETGLGADSGSLIEPRAGSYQILFIEDDRLAQMAMSRYLLKQGYSYVVASNGKEAIGNIKDNSFGLIISDYTLPDMDGVEIAREVRATGVEIPLLFLTGRDNVEIEGRVEGLNVIGVLQKPVSFPDLKKILAEHFRK